MVLSPIVFASHASLYAALATVGLIAGIAIHRRVSRWILLTVTVGATLLSLAAGQPMCNPIAPGSVVVMVDLSPSTRGATFRDRQSLDRRIHQLLGDHPYELVAFADRNQPLDAKSQLTDIPSDRTIFDPPPADAVVLFSDGRFDLPAYAPPTYPIIDPAMDDPGDAAITNLSLAGNRVIASITRNTRPIHWDGATPVDAQSATPTGSGEITATLPPGDLWPENDSLSLNLPPPITAARWWIGTNGPASWENKSAPPTNAADYLQPGAIVLNNLPIDAISSQDQLHLVQYVRDLGGSLLIVGGNHAFAAGHYDGTPLDDLSPLASSPPQPTMRWTLLIDASGSMAGDPWNTETAAITSLLPALPVNDLVNLGSFSQEITWWSHDHSAAEIAKLHFPPANVHPNGPTNLSAALAQLANGDPSSPTQLLLMTDADADLPNADELAAKMRDKKIHLHLLALGHGKALPALQNIADATGGSVLEQLDSKQWISSANELLRSALPSRYQHLPVQLSPGGNWIPDWNQTWARPTATIIQQTAIAPMTARWQVGLGQVTAIAYPADAEVVKAFADQTAQPPGDPRYTVKWNAGSTLHVSVDAVDGNQYLNNQNIAMESFDPHTGAAKQTAIPQTAPGLYELNLPAPRTSTFITVKKDARTLRRFAVAGRYPPEFNAIGNDRPNLQALANNTGGTLIPPGPANPINFPGRTKSTDLSSEFTIAGFIVIAGGLIQHRRARS